MERTPGLVKTKYVILRIPLSNHLRQILNLLSPLHPLTRFLCIQGDQCIPNYPDKNIPTLLMYRNGDCLGQVVGLKGGLGTIAMGESLSRYQREPANA